MKHPSAPPPSSRRASASGRAREVHPLLDAFPLTVMTLAAVIMIFALTMTWRDTREDSALRTSTSTSHTTSYDASAVTAGTRTGTPESESRSDRDSSDSWRDHVDRLN